MSESDRVEQLLLDVAEIKHGIRSVRELLITHVDAFRNVDQAQQREIELLKTRSSALEVSTATEVARLYERIHTIYVVGGVAVSLVALLNVILPHLIP